MNKNSIIKLFKDNYRNENALEVYYDFSGISGFFVPNRVYDDNIQFGTASPPSFYVNEEYYPGIFTSCYNLQNYTGSGLFTGTTTLRVLNNLSGDHLTLFYNFGNFNCGDSFSLVSNSSTGLYKIPSGKIQVLSHIKSTYNTQPFEIILGLNNANKMTLDFSGRTTGVSEIYKSINNAELANQNISSLRLNSNNIEYTYFDIIEDEIYNKIIPLNNNYFQQPKKIYIGNFESGSTRDHYTGYFGLIDDFTAYSEYIDESFCNDLCKLHIKTGERTGLVTTTSIQRNLIQSGYLNPTGVIGSGITGYALIPSNSIINAACGENCVVYVKSGITGILTGEKIEYKIVGQENINSSTEQIIYNLYNENYACNFTKTSIVFTPKLDQDDFFDINYYKDFTNRVETPVYSQLNNNYITNDNFVEKNKLIFFNGVNIGSGDYIITGSSNSKFSINLYDKETEDLVTYSISDYTGSTGARFYYNGNSAQVFVAPVSSPLFRSPNLFLNGQKLIFGYNYSLVTTQALRRIILQTGTIPTGIIDLISDNFTRSITGSNVKYISSGNYNNERIWVNGIFQNKNENYILTSCSNLMLLSNNELDIKQQPIFTGDYYRFNQV
jgi:hypothetical protein